MMSKSKYIRQPLGELPANFDSITETYEHVRALDITSDDAKVRVMFVLDHVPAEDLNSGKLCFGPTGELLMNMFEYLQNTFLGLVNIEQNTVIKIFTVVTVVFMPPTLIASIYGMNFTVMPELKWVGGYPFAIILMVLSSMGFLWYFKRKKWL